MADQVGAEKKKTEEQLKALKGAIGILNNRVVVLEQRNRSLDALVRKTSQELQHLKGQLATRG